MNTQPRPQFPLEWYTKFTIISFATDKSALADQMRNKCLEVLEKKTFDNFMNYERDNNEQNITKSRVESEILKEMNNHEIELLDNQNLINLIEESERCLSTIRKYEQSSKSTKKRYEELKKQIDKLGDKVSGIYFLLQNMDVINPG